MNSLPFNRQASKELVPLKADGVIKRWWTSLAVAVAVVVADAGELCGLTEGV